MAPQTRAKRQQLRADGMKKKQKMVFETGKVNKSMTMGKGSQKMKKM
jgi:hypothetical protein